jgi:hypothetical protein
MNFHFFFTFDIEKQSTFEVLLHRMHIQICFHDKRKKEKKQIKICILKSDHVKPEKDTKRE